MSDEVTTKKPEEMSAFFNARVEGYDEHMREIVESFSEFYTSVSTVIPETEEALDILDLGAGTGIELDYIFRRAPNSRVTAIDLSSDMLDRLGKKLEINRQRIRIVKGSYLTLPLGVGVYDYVMSVMSLHHLTFQAKLRLYRRIHNALRDGGMYIEGDYIVSEEEEKRMQGLYRSVQEEFSLSDAGSHHIDIPFGEKTQQRALNEAGFANLRVVFSTKRANVCVAVKK